MFGLKDMYAERDRLYWRCKRLEIKAETERSLMKRQVLDAVSSTKGVITSFALGMTTQTDAAIGIRKSLLKAAQVEAIKVATDYAVKKFNIG